MTREEALELARKFVRDASVFKNFHKDEDDYWTADVVLFTGEKMYFSMPDWYPEGYNLVSA